MRNAFSSVPFSLMTALLTRLHFSPGFIRLFSHILRLGGFHTQGNAQPFYASSGIRQGCPLSALLFVLFYEIALRCLSHWQPIAFVDDVVAVTLSTSDSVAFIQESRTALQRMGMELNVSKTEVLTVGTMTPIDMNVPSTSPESLAWVYQPRPMGGQPAPPVSSTLPPPPLPPTTITSTTAVTHLGHPLTAELSPQSMYASVRDSVHEVFSQFHKRPLPMYARLRVLNQVLAPLVLYRLECIPPVAKHLEQLGQLTRKFLLGLTDVPSFLSTKTLFSHRKVGLGAFHLPTLVPQRVMDTTHRTIKLLQSMCFAIPPDGWIVQCISDSCAALGVVPHAMAIPSLVRPPCESSTAPHFLPSLDLPYYEVAHPLVLPDKTAYADGSFFPSLSQCASSVILPNHRATVLRPRGKPSCYRAEVYALAMAVDLVSNEFTIFTDSAATLAAVKGSSPRVTLAHAIHHIRKMVAEKHLNLRHIRGHQGFEGNELADKIAKEACLTLPNPPSQVAQHPWDVVVCGELQTPPHKTWVRSHIPCHSHTDIHPWSWKPLVHAGWLPWLFGAKSVKGFAHPSTYWRNQTSPTPCSFCQEHHNASIHGSIGLCNAVRANPLVQLWLHAWGVHTPLITAWREQASARDRFLLGKLVLPNSLVATLRQALGPRGARNAANGFQRHILPSLTAFLPQWSVAERQNFKRKLNPYDPGGWDVGPEPLPTRARRSAPSYPQPRAHLSTCLRRASSTTHPITSYFLPPRPTVHPNASPR